MNHVVITGASSGIGHALAEALAKEGWTVWAGVRQAGTLNALTQTYANLHECQLDITNEAHLRTLAARVASAHPTHVSLVNNAGISAGGPVEGVGLETWRKVFDVNLFGGVRTTQIFLPLIRSTKGRIVNMGSISGRVTPPYMAIYSASKHALRAETDALRVEMRKFGVRVSLIEPGPVQTGIWDKTLKEVTQTYHNMGPDLLKTYDISLAKVTKMIQQTNETGVHVSDVVAVVRHALTQSNPRAYYPVGRGMRSKRALVSVLPVALRDWIFSRTL